MSLWMAAEVMTFGNMLTFFRMLKMRDKKAIARDFGINADTFETWLKSLNFVRNVCAHHGRLWNRHLAIAPGIPNKDPRWHEKRYPIVPHRIYSVLCILKQLIDVIAPQSRWPARGACASRRPARGGQTARIGGRSRCTGGSCSN